MPLTDLKQSTRCMQTNVETVPKQITESTSTFRDRKGGTNERSQGDIVSTPELVTEDDGVGSKRTSAVYLRYSHLAQKSRSSGHERKEKRNQLQSLKMPLGRLQEPAHLPLSTQMTSIIGKPAHQTLTQSKSTSKTWSKPVRPQRHCFAPSLR